MLHDGFIHSLSPVCATLYVNYTYLEDASQLDPAVEQHMTFRHGRLQLSAQCSDL
jgi:hypothetical protein